ncbi:ester cyclase [Candidatus Poribacteria bacterium]|nr:ester cyclase [Candidatus Poribacteria bacterium]
MFQNTSLLIIAVGTLLTALSTVSQSPAQTKERLLAILKEVDDATKAHDADWLLSLFTEDALFDVVVIPPMNKEEDRIWIKGYYSSHPSMSLSETFSLVSVSENVGISEHYLTSVWQDKGIPTSIFHMDIMDFEGDKMKRLTVYADFATEIIQAGVMPGRNLGDMIPSFNLPDSEKTGLVPLKASEELTARINAHNLVSLAKMVRKDADIRFPYIDRPSNRSEFIDIYEQIMAGFPDAQWKTSRKLDMGDGWVVTEATLKGTNNGLFLGNPATGLPIEVRAGWIEHYDDKGLAKVLHFHFDTLTIANQLKGESSVAN